MVYQEVLGDGGRARPRPDACGCEDAARVCPRDELAGGWMGPPPWRIDHRDPGRRRHREGSRTDLLALATYTSSTPEPPGHQSPLVPVRSRIADFSELVFYV